MPNKRTFIEYSKRDPTLLKFSLALCEDFFIYFKSTKLSQGLIPIHNRDLKKGTLKSILRQAELSVEDLIKLL